ncbi:hypothetical protein [Nocardioides sp. 1609]|uniref:hypothetical protein n=1 Tax=Nocardioides sp. 1609 TaxID=2508327 RepID=UPI00142F9AFE|nr:hypothetical protein [Nocardioides sp. 1609]
MSNIAELEASLQDLFETFDMSDIDHNADLDLVDGEVREIRTDLTVLAASRPSGN